MNRSHAFLVSTLFLLLAAAMTAPAASVNFRSTPGQTNLTSLGAPSLMDDGFVFSLGAFKDSFVPSPANTHDWASKWVPVASTTYNSQTRLFAGNGTVTSNAAPFGTSSKGYIWGFRTSGGRNEWILVTDSAWTWPYASGLAFPVIWQISGTSQAIVGEINGTGFQMKSSEVAPTAYPPALTPEKWMALYPSAGSWNADPDKDGLDNLTEYALGLCPLKANTNAEPLYAVVEDSGSTFPSLVVRRSASASADLFIEFSSDLVVWEEPQATGTIIASNAVELHVRDDLALASNGRRFARLRISLP